MNKITVTTFMVLFVFFNACRTKNPAEDFKNMQTRCYALFNTGNWQAAYLVADSMVHEKAHDYHGYGLRGFAAVMLNRHQEAMMDFNHVLSLDSSWADIYFFRAQCYLYENKRDSAFYDVWRAQHIDSSFEYELKTHSFLDSNFTQEFIQQKIDELNHIKVVYTYDAKGLRNGGYKKYFSNGVLLEEGNYKEGKLHGVVRVYYKNGKPESESNYDNDVPNGKFKKWYENEKPESEMNYVAGKLNGEATIWLRDGKLRSRGMYRDDLIDGVCTTWNEKMKAYVQETYKNDVMINRKILN